MSLNLPDFELSSDGLPDQLVVGQAECLDALESSNEMGTRECAHLIVVLLGGNNRAGECQSGVLHWEFGEVMMGVALIKLVSKEGREKEV
jgi:hypothetical protein